MNQYEIINNNSDELPPPPPPPIPHAPANAPPDLIGQPLAQTSALRNGDDVELDSLQLAVSNNRASGEKTNPRRSDTSLSMSEQESLRKSRANRKPRASKFDRCELVCYFFIAICLFFAVLAVIGICGFFVLQIFDTVPPTPSAIADQPTTRKPFDHQEEKSGLFKKHGSLLSREGSANMTSSTPSRISDLSHNTTTEASRSTSSTPAPSTTSDGFNSTTTTEASRSTSSTPAPSTTPDEFNGTTTTEAARSTGSNMTSTGQFNNTASRGSTSSAPPLENVTSSEEAENSTLTNDGTVFIP